jgi:ParB family chromosome partitioning protein
MADEARSRLGRGLAALIGDVDVETKNSERARPPRRVPIEFLKPNPRNPRRTYPETELEELAQSLRERGMVQPIVVRKAKGAAEEYEIIAGERRWRAAQRAGLHEVPIVVLEVSDAEALELAIIENVQRADLNPLEEAAGYQALAAEFKRSQEEIAEIVGKSRSHVANTLRLLKLPETVKAYISAGKLSAGHARALVNMADPEAVARDIVERGLTVRETESIAQQQAAAAGKTALALEKRVSDALGLVVSVDHRGKGGTLHIRYRDLEQLEEILRRLERG